MIKLCKKIRIFKTIYHMDDFKIFLTGEDNFNLHNPNGPASIRIVSGIFNRAEFYIHGKFKNKYPSSIMKLCGGYNANWYKYDKYYIKKIYHKDFSIHSIKVEMAQKNIYKQYPKGKKFDNLKRYLKEINELCEYLKQHNYIKKFKIEGYNDTL